jgi:protein-L-isoaspartate O-methyltransferase
LSLHLNPRTGKTYLDGVGEPEVQAALQKYLHPGMVFYDIGANIGFFSLLAARLVGKEGRVAAFEADPEIARRLREHAARNEFGWITVDGIFRADGSDDIARSRSGPRGSFRHCGDYRGDCGLSG